MNIEKLKMLAELLEEFKDEAADRHEHEKRNSVLFDVRFEIQTMPRGEEAQCLDPLTIALRYLEIIASPTITKREAIDVIKKEFGL